MPGSLRASLVSLKCTGSASRQEHPLMSQTDSRSQALCGAVVAFVCEGAGAPASVLEVGVPGTLSVPRRNRRLLTLIGLRCRIGGGLGRKVRCADCPTRS